MQRFVSHSVQDTEKIAAKLAEKLKGGEVIAFTGPMGMGKTAFTRGLVLALGGGDVVSSPTFALVNEYDARLTVQHFDMYRVSGWDDLYSTGFFDYLDTASRFAGLFFCVRQNLPCGYPCRTFAAAASLSACLRRCHGGAGDG